MTYTTRRERRESEKLQAKQLRNRRLVAGGASLSILVGATFASSTAAVAASASSVSSSSSSAKTTTWLNMRTGAGVNNSVITVLDLGASVTLTGQSQGPWVQVEAAGHTGWVNSSYLTTGRTTAQRAAATTSSATGSATTTSYLNVRTGPGVGNSVVTVLNRGAAVSLSGQTSSSWVKITAAGRTGWVNKNYLTSGSRSSAATTRSGSASVSASKIQLASTTTPASSWKAAAANWARTKANSSSTYYSWGGNGPNGYDCSGFTSGAFSAAGKSLPRTSRSQYSNADQFVSLNNVQVGDLVFWSNNGAASGIYHVAIYIGDGKIAHARNPSSGVSVTSLNYSPYNMLGTAARYN